MESLTWSRIPTGGVRIAGVDPTDQSRVAWDCGRPGKNASGCGVRCPCPRRGAHGPGFVRKRPRQLRQHCQRRLPAMRCSKKIRPCVVHSPGYISSSFYFSPWLFKCDVHTSAHSPCYDWQQGTLFSASISLPANFLSFFVIPAFLQWCACCSGKLTRQRSASYLIEPVTVR
jgi:hypothetical protein